MDLSNRVTVSYVFWLAPSSPRSFCAEGDRPVIMSDVERPECVASTSYQTIRGGPTMHIELPSASLPSSPHSSALPSPPDSPNSVSSLPSLNSSFFLSSADVSPPHPATDAARDSTAGLVIPSLTLPPALSQPTAYGKTLADLRLIVLGGAADFLRVARTPARHGRHTQVYISYCS